MHNTQADLKKLEPIERKSHSSEVQETSGKRDALVSSEQGNLIRSAVFRNANSSTLEKDLFLKVKRIICSIRQDQAWRDTNFMSSPLNKSIGEPQRQTEEQRLALQDPHLLNLDENKFDYKKNLSKYSNAKYARNGRSSERKNFEQMKSLRKSSEEITRQFSNSLPNCSKCRNK